MKMQSGKRAVRGKCFLDILSDSGANSIYEISASKEAVVKALSSADPGAIVSLPVDSVEEGTLLIYTDKVSVINCCNVLEDVEQVREVIVPSEKPVSGLLANALGNGAPTDDDVDDDDDEDEID